MNGQAAALGVGSPRWSSISVYSEFPLEWIGVALVALINSMWARAAGFDLTIGLRDLLAMAGILVVAWYFRTIYRRRPGALMTEYFALCLVSAATFAELTYLCCALDRPAVDARLLSLDRALGFDWLFWFNAARSHPIVMSVLRFFYGSIMIQGTYFFVLFGFRQDLLRLREIFWMTFAASAIACAFSALWPALGTFEIFRLGDLGGYLGDIHHLRHGTALHFNVEHLNGIVTFPSFHTSLAIIYTYAFRKTGPIGWVVAVVNLLMLPAIPFIGGHYLVDMLGGAAVGILVILCVRACLYRKRESTFDHPFNTAETAPATATAGCACV